MNQYLRIYKKIYIKENKQYGQLSNIMDTINAVLQNGGKLSIQTLDGQQLILDQENIISIINDIPIVKNIQTQPTEKPIEPITNKENYQIKLNPYSNCKKISDQYSMNISHICHKHNSDVYYGNGKQPT